MGAPESTGPEHDRTAARGTAPTARGTHGSEGLGAALAERARARRARLEDWAPELEDEMAAMRVRQEKREAAEQTAAAQRRERDAPIIGDALGGFARLAAEAFPAPGGEAGTVAPFATPPPMRVMPLDVPPTRRGGRPAPTTARRPHPPGQDARALWKAHYGDRPIAPPLTPAQERLRRLPAPGPGGDISLSHAVALLRRHTVADLTAAGIAFAGLDPAWSLAHPQVTSSVVYVGPGFCGYFTTDGRLDESSPVGPSAGVAEFTKPLGVLFAISDAYIDLRAPQVWHRRKRIGLNMDLRHDESIAVERWQASLAGVVFVASPSCWNRRGVASWVRRGPGDLWNAICRCITAGYLREAVGEAFSRLDVWDVAKQCFFALVKRLAPVPFPDDLEDIRRWGGPIGIATWGSGPNKAGDIDAAARLFAPLLAEEVVGRAVGGAGKGAKKSAKKGAKKGAKAISGATRRPAHPPVTPAPAVDPRRTGSTMRGRESAATGGRAAERPPAAQARPEAAVDAAARGTTGPATAPRPASMQRFRDELARDGRAADWQRIEEQVRDVAEKYRQAPPASRNGYVAMLKGAVFESTVPGHPAVVVELERARRLAGQMGVDPDSIRFTRDVVDRSGALTDGIVFGTRRPNSARPAARDELPVAGVPEVVVFAVFEAKVEGEIRGLSTAGRQQRGQFELSRARLEELEWPPRDTAGHAVPATRQGVTIDGVLHPPAHLFLPVDFGVPLRLVGVVPRDVTKLKRDLLVQELTGPVSTSNPLGQRRAARIVESPMTDVEAGEIARQLLEAAITEDPP